MPVLKAKVAANLEATVWNTPIEVSGPSCLLRDLLNGSYSLLAANLMYQRKYPWNTTVQIGGAHNVLMIRVGENEFRSRGRHVYDRKPK